MGRYTPARPASHVWNASVEVLRRNARTIRGAAPDLPSDVLGRFAWDRVPTIASARLIKSLGPRASSFYTTAQQLQFRTNPPTNDEFGQQCTQLYIVCKVPSLALGKSPLP
jgi:hypothetical protein